MSHKRKGQLTVSGEWARHLRPLLRRAFWKQERQAERAQVAAEGNEALHSRPSVGSVEKLQAEISALPPDIALVELWVPERLSLGGNPVSRDVALSIVLDHMLSLGLFPQGVEWQAGGSLNLYSRG